MLVQGSENVNCCASAAAFTPVMEGANIWQKAIFASINPYF